MRGAFEWVLVASFLNGSLLFFFHLSLHSLWFHEHFLPSQVLIISVTLISSVLPAACSTVGLADSNAVHMRAQPANPPVLQAILPGCNLLQLKLTNR